ncbi:hypothetical protein OHA72_47925 [Dactylosporangium sp. NBC_01737]|uniref:lantibiotic dehydratase C-terminal domain-containing protein n=1 Tax=Dactylosporangium sp. NBC_01737 TaxID=2975959 RepID=UPI002E12980E|nr:hypothetical protein OHA72_47925 [Dactylosporangium sp. NBC_01737]
MRSWHTLHIAYHDADKDGLLLDRIRPALARLGADGTDAFLLRHWWRGPYLRLNVRTDERAWRERVRPLVEKAVGAYLAAHPSVTVLDPAASLDRHRVLALQEYERGPLTLWYPNNPATARTRWPNGSAPSCAAWTTRAHRRCRSSGSGPRCSGVTARPSPRSSVTVLSSDPRRRRTGRRGVEHSELHRLMFDHAAYHETVFTRPDFLRYRVALNATYLHLTRLGLTPMDRVSGRSGWSATSFGAPPDGPGGACSASLGR